MEDIIEGLKESLIEEQGGLLVEKAGLLDTIQDQGRWGFQGSGMVVAGAMDPYAYTMGNILLGNDRQAASLEITLLGPQLRFALPTYIVLTGGNLSPKVNHKPVPMWKVLQIQANDLLTFGSIQSGCRTYLSVKGGFQVPALMGSRSTYTKGKIGGWNGRALEKEDVIPYLSFERTVPAFPKLSYKWIPSYEEELTLRVILGPQEDRFTEQGIQTFLEKPYTVTLQMDRMGIRLEGETIEHSDGADILSDAMPLGGIQIPPDGKPIILMSDRQTTGGYTKIGCVISVDLQKAAQVRPNQTIRFESVSVQEAQELYRKQENLFRVLSLISKR